MDRVLSEASDRLRGQLVHADRILSGTLEAVEDAGTKLRNGFWRPVRKASGLPAGDQSGTGLAAIKACGSAARRTTRRRTFHLKVSNQSLPSTREDGISGRRSCLPFFLCKRGCWEFRKRQLSNGSSRRRDTIAIIKYCALAGGDGTLRDIENYAGMLWSRASTVASAASCLWRILTDARNEASGILQETQFTFSISHVVLCRAWSSPTTTRFVCASMLST